MQNLNEIQIDLSILPDSAKTELFDFYKILMKKYHCRPDDDPKQNIWFSGKENRDILIGLFDGASDLAIRSEKILQQETVRNSGWTWKKQS